MHFIDTYMYVKVRYVVKILGRADIFEQFIFIYFNNAFSSIHHIVLIIPVNLIWIWISQHFLYHTIWST